MRSATMLPVSKPGAVFRRNHSVGPEINSFSSIVKDAPRGTRGNCMQTLGYAKRAKKTWIDL